jgi:hypothetical protein
MDLKSKMKKLESKAQKNMKPKETKCLADKLLDILEAPDEELTEEELKFKKKSLKEELLNLEKKEKTGEK